VTDPTPITLPPPSRLRRRIILAALAVMVLLLLVITPPLLNVNRLQRRIASAMSQSLGRAVHMDRVTLHLLPMPGFTIENLVVSEDPAFGYEPVIRANTVEATLRPSSLWRRQVEFSTIRFIEPSLNLVRNREGRWNLQSLLTRAAAVPSAPTAQSKAGPAPRFPYIEATGARVNLKLGDEKQPFSLTEADFALWRPEPDRWSVRVDGKAARTDLNLSDSGTISLEGSLDRAANITTVPLDLHLSWKKAQLGDASRLLFGYDAGWRGTGTIEASLTGSLAAAELHAVLHLQDLRRSDFVPIKLLEYYLDCNATADISTAFLHHPACSLTTEKPGPIEKSFTLQSPSINPYPSINAVADSIDLTQLPASNGITGPSGISGLELGSGGFPESWVLDWTRLFTRRIPESVTADGKVRGSLTLSSTHPPVWLGTVTGDTTTPNSTFTVTSDATGFTLAPLNLASTPKAPPLILAGDLNPQRYTFTLTGTATPDELTNLRTMVPPLAEGLDSALPAAALSSPDAAPKPLKLAIRCTRPWQSSQTCTLATPEPPQHPTRHHR
jgi:AsmA protein